MLPEDFVASRKVTYYSTSVSASMFREGTLEPALNQVLREARFAEANVPADLHEYILATSEWTSIAINEGDLWVIASALFWAGHVLLVGHSGSRGAGPFTIACGQFIVCGVLGSIVALATETVTWSGIAAAGGAIAYAGILSVGVGFTAQVVGQRHTPAADTAIILSTETAFAAIFGSLWLGERLNGLGMIGCALILSGILLVQLLPLFDAMRRASSR